MKKKIIAVAAMSMLFAGVVHASSLNGDYKGNPIVNVKSNGVVLESDEVPAIIYDGHTVVPISMLRQLGASVTWDQDTYSVNVKLPASSSFSLNQLASDMKKYSVDNVLMYADGNAINTLSYTYRGSLSDLFANHADAFGEMLNRSTATDVNRTEIVDSAGNTFYVPTQSMRDFQANKISAAELATKYKIESKSGATPAPASTPEPVQQDNSAPISVQPNPTPAPVAASPSPTPTPNTALIDICKQIDYTYQINLQEFNDHNDPFNGRTKYLKDQFDHDYQIQKQAAGCN